MGADRVPRSKWGRVITWGGLILLVTCLPYLIAWQAAPPGYQFGGILVNPLLKRYHFWPLLAIEYIGVARKRA